jgi:hypothetical protein
MLTDLRPNVQISLYKMNTGLLSQSKSHRDRKTEEQQPKQRALWVRSRRNEPTVRSRDGDCVANLSTPLYETVQVLDTAAQQCNVPEVPDVYRAAARMVASDVFQWADDLLPLSNRASIKHQKSCRRGLEQMFSSDTIRLTFGSEEGGDSGYLIDNLYLLKPQSGKQTRLQSVKETRHFEALDPSRDEDRVRSSVRP